MRKLIDGLLDLVYPTRCILCRERISPGRPRICDRCQRITPSAEGGSKTGDFYSACVSALYYEGAARDAILRYKFQGTRAYAPAFGELVAERVYAELDGRYDILSWVPLSPDRLRERGYDQTRLIAENAAGRLCRELVPTLKKRRGVHPQSLAGDKARRRENITGAFTVLDPALIADRKILIIDDIVTTGATLSECAKTLLLAGADEVMCATLARTR